MQIEPASVIVIDDHPLYRDGVIRSLEESGFTVVAQGASAEEACTLCAEHRPAIVLLDISMPGGGVEAARRIGSEVKGTRMIMLTVSESNDDIMRALDAGASGYVLKGVSAAELAQIVRSVANGESYITPTLAARILKTMKPAGSGTQALEEAALTTREEQILWLVADGLSNKEVGRRLRLQEKTVKHYMTNVLQKLQVRNRTEAAIKARAMREVKS
ncbi:response regulator [Pararhizobium haloflavum]|uniref:response regulator n=1 Tax=Pararhizobium haloflavum TaxID=2037914 RepID=UPI000C1813E3|nr:response regulator transcription factor [Pararhizobium haloflavum]